VRKSQEGLLRFIWWSWSRWLFNAVLHHKEGKVRYLCYKSPFVMSCWLTLCQILLMPFCTCQIWFQ